MIVFLLLPYAYSVFATVVLSIYVGTKGIELISRHFFKKILWYIPVLVLALLATFLVPNSDGSIVPLKIVAYFLPLFWSIILYIIWDWSLK